MKEGRPSITATFVAFARGAASGWPMTHPVLDDAAAARLLPFVVQRLVPRSAAGQAAARVVTLGLVDHVALRTLAIDDALAGAFGQVVILGAGLDARAYRLSALDGAHVFEVDHPASQAAKRLRVRGLAPRCRTLTHVALDFGTDDLDLALAAHGHDRAVPTAWVLEGVTMYLPEAIATRLFAVVGARSAPGSLLAATYMRPPRRPLPAVVRRAFDLALHGIGEPLGAMYTPAEIASRLRAAGLEPRSDTSSLEQASRFGASPLLARPFRSERLVVATRG